MANLHPSMGYYSVVESDGDEGRCRKKWGGFSIRNYSLFYIRVSNSVGLFTTEIERNYRKLEMKKITKDFEFIEFPVVVVVVFFVVCLFHSWLNII